MIYFPFKNYGEFKELFGVCEHGNGVKSRRNKILLSLYKNRSYLHQIASAPVAAWMEPDCCTYVEKLDRHVWHDELRYEVDYPYGVNLLEAKDMTGLRERLYKILGNVDGMCYRLNLNGRTFRSNVFSTDDFMGVCEDGDENSIRYVNHERDSRVFKMKAGKLLRKVVEEARGLDDILTEQVKIWLCEQFAEEWKAYASQFTSDFELHVGDNFSDIYDSDYLDGHFSSCMVDRGFHEFYSRAVNAKAAYLTKKGQHGEYNSIVARCIIFPEVHVCDSDKVLRLAERQYASEGSDKLKRQLIMKLIEAGEIDGYKRIGANCGDSKGFVDVHGNSLPSTDLWIECDIDTDCHVSYQDSFKYYNESRRKAYNNANHDYAYNLAITEGSIFDDHENESWSSYNDCWIPDDEAYYVETRNDYFYEYQTVEANRIRSSGRCYTETCFKDDCIQIGDEYYYAGEDAEEYEEYGIGRCPVCGDYFLKSDCCYSDLTDERYCCDSCLDDAEDDYRKDHGHVWSEYDGEWYEDADEVSKALVWSPRYDWRVGEYVWSYKEQTVSIDTLNDLIEDGEAAYVNDVAYIDKIGFDGEPVHIAAASLVAA